MPAPQTYKNHARFQPIFHFFVAPILLANVIVAIVVVVRRWPNDIGGHLWAVVVAIALLLVAGLARANALKAQDRTIRLEEKLRLASLVSPSELVELESLTTPQYIALRFASNPEIPDLARRAVREHLTNKQIKQAIIAWRPDYDRI